MAIGNIISYAVSSLSNLSKDLSGQQTILFSISIIIVVAAVFALIFKVFKQELIPAFIIAGVILGPLCLGIINDKTLISGFAEIGIVFLLFVVGLEMNLKKLKETIGTSFVVGLIQVVIVALFSFLLLTLLKFSSLESIILGITIAFSSTVIVTKILADSGQLNTLHARFIIGILLTQDIIAILFLAFLSKQLTSAFVIITLIKLVLLVSLAVLFNLKIIKPVMQKAASSQELLLIVSIAFLFLFSLLSLALGFSIAIGAFIAGIILGNTNFRQEIEARIKPLRDFFLILFFIAVGMWLTNISREILLPTAIVLVILIIFKPLISAFLLKVKGYKTRTCVNTGISLAQLSEFTLIICLSALGLGLIGQRAFDVIILSTIISFIITPYIIKLEKPFSRFFGFLSLMKTKHLEKMEYPLEGKKTVLIFGCHRMGSILLKGLDKHKEKIVVVDFNPDIIKGLMKQKIACVYGDALHKELFDKIPLQDLKIIISTIPRKDENLELIKFFKKVKPSIFVMVTAEKIHDALALYNGGADYVIVPSIVTGEQSLDMIKRLSKKEFAKIKREHIKYLEELHGFLY
jgi:Kef-type K+ transport system membrane component KefB